MGDSDVVVLPVRSPHLTRSSSEVAARVYLGQRPPGDVTSRAPALGPGSSGHSPRSADYLSAVPLAGLSWLGGRGAWPGFSLASSLGDVTSRVPAFGPGSSGYSPIVARVFASCVSGWIFRLGVVRSWPGDSLWPRPWAVPSPASWPGRSQTLAGPAAGCPLSGLLVGAVADACRSVSAHGQSSGRAGEATRAGGG